jgi:hypothetical protein
MVAVAGRSNPAQTIVLVGLPCDTALELVAE